MGESLNIFETLRFLVPSYAKCMIINCVILVWRIKDDKGAINEFIIV